MAQGCLKDEKCVFIFVLTFLAWRYTGRDDIPFPIFLHDHHKEDVLVGLVRNGMGTFGEGSE